MNQQNQGRQWSTVAAGSDNQQWKPQATEKNGMHFIPGAPTNVLEGYFAQTKEIKGQNGYFNVHVIQVLEPHGALGECIDVMGDTVLNDRLSKVEMGTYVRLEYKGRVHKKGYPANSPWSQTNSYHNWDVAEDTGAVKLHQLAGVQPSGNPVTNQNMSTQHVPQQQGGYQQPQAPQGGQQWTPPANNQMQGNQQYQNQGGNFTQQGQPMQQQNFQQQGQPMQNQGWTPPSGNQSFPPVNGNFGGNQQQVSTPMNGGNGQNLNQGGGTPFSGDDSDLPFRKVVEKFIF